MNSFVFPWCNRLNRASAVSFLNFIDHTQANTHTHTHTHTHTFGVRAPLNDWAVRHGARCLHITQQAQGKNFYALSGIRTSIPSNHDVFTYALESTVSGIGWEVRYRRFLRICECLLLKVVSCLVVHEKKCLLCLERRWMQNSQTEQANFPFLYAFCEETHGQCLKSAGVCIPTVAAQAEIFSGMHQLSRDMELFTKIGGLPRTRLSHITYIY